MEGRNVWQGKPIILADDPISVAITQATADLAPLGIYASLDHRLVKASADGSRLVTLSKPILYAAMEDASLWLSTPPSPRTTAIDKKKLKDGTEVEINRETLIVDGIRREVTTRKVKGEVVSERTTDKQANNSLIKSEPPPQRVVDAVHERGEYPELHELRGVRSFPYGRRDGTLVHEAGYDPLTKYIFAPSRSFTLPADLSHEAAKQYARELLDDVFSDFPLSDDGRGAIYSLLLTIIMRPATGAAPLFALDATTRGAGKTLLAKLCALIGSGALPMLIPFRGREEEQEKTLASALREGASMINIDNADAPIGGATLEAVLTADDEVMLRPLGTSTMERVNTATTIVVTGNGLRFSGDLGSRRVIMARLEPDQERPEERSGFKHDDILTYVRENAPALNRKLLGTLAAFERAGRPASGLTRMGGFEGWTRLVRDCVVWLGLNDPCACRPLLHDQDPDREFLASLLPAIQAADKDGHGLSTRAIASLPTASGALDEFTDSAGRVNVMRLGRRLTRFVGRRVNGLKLVAPTRTGGKSQWRVASAGVST